jgi:hypothetical protein
LIQKPIFFLPKTLGKEPKHLDKAINDLKKSQKKHTQKPKINLKTKNLLKFRYDF